MYLGKEGNEEGRRERKDEAEGGLSSLFLGEQILSVRCIGPLRLGSRIIEHFFSLCGPLDSSICVNLMRTPVVYFLKDNVWLGQVYKQGEMLYDVLVVVILGVICLDVHACQLRSYLDTYPSLRDTHDGRLTFLFLPSLHHVYISLYLFFYPCTNTHAHMHRTDKPPKPPPIRSPFNYPSTPSPSPLTPFVLFSLGTQILPTYLHLFIYLTLLLVSCIYTHKSLLLSKD